MNTYETEGHEDLECHETFEEVVGREANSELITEMVNETYNRFTALAESDNERSIEESEEEDEEEVAREIHEESIRNMPKFVPVNNPILKRQNAEVILSKPDLNARFGKISLNRQRSESHELPNLSREDDPFFRINLFRESEELPRHDYIIPDSVLREPSPPKLAEITERHGGENIFYDLPRHARREILEEELHGLETYEKLPYVIRISSKKVRKEYLAKNSFDRAIMVGELRFIKNEKKKARTAKKLASASA